MTDGRVMGKLAILDDSVRRHSTDDFESCCSFNNRNFTINSDVVEDLQFTRRPTDRQLVDALCRSHAHVQSGRALSHESVRCEEIADDRSAVGFDRRPSPDRTNVALDAP